MKKIQHAKGHSAARAEHYPGWQELADAIYWERRGNPKPMEDWLKRVDETKARFPKPAEPNLQN